LQKIFSNKKIVVIGLATIGVFLGIVIFFTFLFQDLNISDTLLAKSGVMTIEEMDKVYRLSLEEYGKKTSQGKVQITYSEDNAPKVELIKQVLATKPLEDLLAKSDKSVFMLVHSDVPAEQIESINEKVVFTPDLVLASGNYIYTSGTDFLFESPERFFENIYSAVEYTVLFNEFGQKDIEDFVELEQKYDLAEAPSVLDYAKLTQGSVDDWRLPYPDKVDLYRQNSYVCDLKDKSGNVIHRPGELFICESVLYLKGQLALIPPNAKTNIENVDWLTQGAYESEVSLTGQTKINQLLQNLGLKESGFKFESWDMAQFESQEPYDEMGAIYLSNITADKIEDLKAKLQENHGWSFKEKSETVKDDQFGADQYKLTFTKKQDYLSGELVILVMNTNQLNADCIMPNVGQAFCNDNSLYKSSQLYLKINANERIEF
jgi:hypothetical protein